MKSLDNLQDYALTAEDQNIYSLVANAPEEYATYEVAETVEEEIRNELSDAIGDLGKSMQLLILLLDQNNIINMLPEFAVPQYSDIMNSISDAAMKGMEAVLKSHEFDKNISLSMAMDECAYLQ